MESLTINLSPHFKNESYNAISRSIDLLIEQSEECTPHALTFGPTNVMIGVILAYAHLLNPTTQQNLIMTGVISIVGLYS